MNNRPDMEEDMYLSDWFRTKVRTNGTYSQNLYAALCNNDFQKLDVIPILTEETWSCSWRAAGGIVARIRKEGDYLDWYCSGIFQEGHHIEGYVEESTVTKEIREDLQKLGWVPLDKTK